MLNYVLKCLILVHDLRFFFFLANNYFQYFIWWKNYNFAWWVWVKTWSPMLREEQMLKIFENGVMRKIYWSNMEEVPGEWINLLNNHLIDFFLLIKCCLCLINEGCWEGESVRHIPVRPRHIWKNDIKMIHQEIVSEVLTVINLA